MIKQLTALFVAFSLTVLIIILLLSCTTSVNAETSIVINGLSWHDSDIDFNEKNYGLGLETDLNEKVFIYGGFFKDSFNETAKYVGTGYKIFTKEEFSFNVVSGITHKNVNWNEEKLFPYILPSLSFYNFNLIVLSEGQYKDYEWPTTLFLQYKIKIPYIE